MAEECNHKNLYTACDLKTKQNKTNSATNKSLPIQLPER